MLWLAVLATGAGVPWLQLAGKLALLGLLVALSPVGIAVALLRYGEGLGDGRYRELSAWFWSPDVLVAALARRQAWLAGVVIAGAAGAALVLRADWGLAPYPIAIGSVFWLVRAESRRQARRRVR